MNKMEDRLSNFYKNGSYDLKSYSRLLYIFLVYMAGDEDSVQVTYKDVQKFAGVKDGTISLAVRELKEHGLVRIEKPHTNRNVYVL